MKGAKTDSEFTTAKSQIQEVSVERKAFTKLIEYSMTQVSGWPILLLCTCTFICRGCFKYQLPAVFTFAVQFF